jgi:pimeloyl-ACP methyl ester carboxylesterase
LDSYLGREDSPITFTIEVSAAMADGLGDLDELGYPDEGNPLRQLVASLSVRAYDVDFPSEQDEVLVNGYRLPGNRTLLGSDQKWSTTSLRVPMQFLRFPQAGQQVISNLIEIDVDQRDEGWNVEIDYADLRLDLPTYDPVVIAHGIGGGQYLEELRRTLDTPGSPFQGAVSRPSLTAHGSVADNAALLLEAIRTSLEDRNACQVDIVAHSMGGLAARQVAEQVPGLIDQVIMVGTPHSGTPWAPRFCAAYESQRQGRRLSPAQRLDLVVLGGIEGLGLGNFGKCDRNDPDDIGLFQLTPQYLRGFNSLTLGRQGVQYSAIASDANDLLPLLVPFAGGPVAEYIESTMGRDHDLLVKLPSALYRTGFHDEIVLPNVVRHHCAGIFSTIHAYQLSPSGGGIRPSDIQGDGIIERVVSILDGDIALLDDCDPGDPAGFASAGAGVSNQIVEVSVVDVPASGAATVSLGAEATVGAPVFVIVDGHDATVTGGGGAFAESIVGTQAIHTGSAGGDSRIVVTNGGDRTVSVATAILVSSARALRMGVPAEVKLGDVLEVSVTLENFNPLADRASLEVTRPQGAPENVPLLPTGLGTWTARIIATDGGDYRFTTRVTGPRPRTTTAQTLVIDPDARFTGGLRATARDDGGDGLFDRLDVDVLLHVLQAGEYRVAGDLAAADGTVLDRATASMAHTIGTDKPITLSFDGRAIGDSTHAGPYRLVNLKLYKDPSLHPQDERGQMGSITAYRSTQFAHFPVRIDATGITDVPTDSNSDAREDALTVSVPVWVDRPGNYVISGSLHDPDEALLVISSATVTLAAGGNTAQLTFPVVQPSYHEQGGELTIKGLSVYLTGDDRANDYLADDYTATTTACTLLRCRTAARPIEAPTISTLSADRIRPGDILTVTGTNFDSYLPGNDVEINNQPAQITQVSQDGTELSVIVPTASSGEVTIATAVGTASSGVILISVPGIAVNTMVYSGPVTTDGQSFPAVVTDPGTVAVATFTGVVGQEYLLKVGHGWGIYNSPSRAIHAPDGTRIVFGSVNNGDTREFTATQAGTYMITIDPVGTLTGTAQLTLWAVPDNPTIALPTDGTRLAIATTTPGQEAVATFTGVVGQEYLLKVEHGWGIYNVPTRAIHAPNGTRIVFGSVNSGDTREFTATQAGAYTIIIDPVGTLTGTTHLTLTSR